MTARPVTVKAPEPAALPATPAVKQLTRQGSDFTAEGSPVPGTVSNLKGQPAAPCPKPQGPARKHTRY